MRVQKIRWVSHSKFPIASVDVQPNGYRFITGGADSFVRVWNLMPVISPLYEDQGESTSESEDEIEDNRVSEGSALPPKKSGKSVQEENGEDSKMVDGHESESDDGLSPEEKLKKEQVEKEFDRDLKLMEGLF